MARGLRTRAEQMRAYWALILPAFVLYLLVMAFPIVLSMVLSLSDWNGGQLFGGERWRVTGLQQYERLARDPQFWLALKNNIYIVIVSVFGQLPLGFVFAYLVYRKIVRFGDFWQGVLYLPAIISVIVLGIMWGMIFSPTGLIADVMNALHARGFTRELERIFGAVGGFTASDIPSSRTTRTTTRVMSSFWLRSPAKRSTSAKTGTAPRPTGAIDGRRANRPI